MTPLSERVRRAIERDALLPPGTRVLAAVSGGTDSVAMLHLLAMLAPGSRFTIAGVVHVNHGLRGAESDGDEAFCRDLAARLGLRFETARADVAALARDSRVSIEVAARRARYAVFNDAAARLEADRIATGHTRDDQAETFLLRVLRGAGSSGLAGIRPASGTVIRPLLDIRHRDLVEFLDEIGEPHREDTSNADVSIPRNWIRHSLLPSLANHFNGDVVEVLSRGAHVLRDESHLLDQLAAAAASTVESAGEDGSISLDIAGLAALPPALARRVVRAAALRVDGSRFLGFDHIEHVISIARNPSGRSAVDIPGIRVERNASTVVLFSRGSRSLPEPVTFRYPLPVPGRAAIPECSCEIEAVEAAVNGLQPSDNKWVVAQHEAVMDASIAAGGLWVRSRMDGDAMRPMGLGGVKKVQDILVDRKVPRLQRDRVPIVVDGDGRILWVGGHVVAEETRVTDSTQTVVILKLSVRETIR